MQFYETLQKLGYETERKEKGWESFKRGTLNSDLYIYFDFANKTVHGYIVPKQLIRSMSYLVELKQDFESLMENIKYLAMLSHYDIIN